MKWIAVLALLFGVACAPWRPYVRNAAPPQEIVFEQTNQSADFVKGGRRITFLRDEDELTDMVACVPEAADFAGRVNSLMITSDILRWSSFAGQLAAAALIVGSAVRNDPSMFRAGLVVLPVSALLWYAKDLPVPFAFARTMDAVNAYNDQYAVTHACGPVRKKKPKPPPDDAPGAAPRLVPPDPEAEPGSSPRR